MSKPDPLMMQLLQEMRKEVRELRDELKSAMGFLRAVKWMGVPVLAMFASVAHKVGVTEFFNSVK